MNPHDRGVPQFSGITKYDLQLAGAGGGGGAGSTVAGQVLHGGSRLGGEAVFVPKPKPSSGAGAGAGAGTGAGASAAATAGASAAPAPASKDAESKRTIAIKVGVRRGFS